MELASGGLSDEQRSKGDLAKAAVVNPQRWRVLDAGPGDDYFIPLGRTSHSVALLKDIAELMGFKQREGGGNGDK